MAAIIAHVAREAGLTVRTIRRDCVASCGPLGGVLTALKRSSAGSVLFLACDMPFISADMLRELVKAAGRRRTVFARSGPGVGFPFVLPVSSACLIEQQIKKGELSLQELARKMKGTKLRLDRKWPAELQNVNTPFKYRQATKRWSKRRTKK